MESTFLESLAYIALEFIHITHSSHVVKHLQIPKQQAVISKNPETTWFQTKFWLI